MSVQSRWHSSLVMTLSQLLRLSLWVQLNPLEIQSRFDRASTGSA